jgi:hypothetical protein
MFFQVASDGWKKNNNKTSSSNSMGETLINITLNLPNGNSLFHNVVHVNTGEDSAKLVEEILSEAIFSICGATPERCVGVVADTDKYSLKALQELEYQRPWMVNLSCQAQGLNNLLKDFNKHLSLFRSVGADCIKLATFFNSQPQANTYLQKYQRQVSIVHTITNRPCVYRCELLSQCLASLLHSACWLGSITISPPPPPPHTHIIGMPTD